MKKHLILLSVTLLSVTLFSQDTTQTSKEYLEVFSSKTFTVGGITIRGAETTDVQAIKLFAGIKEGDQLEVPGERIPKAIQNLWDQDLFSDITISAAEIRGETIYLLIEIVELPKVANKSFVDANNNGLRKGVSDDLNEEIGPIGGRIANENFKTNSENIIRNYFVNKGYLNATVRAKELKNPTQTERIDLQFVVDRGPRIKVNAIEFEGVSAFEEQKLKKKMKNTKEKKWYRLFKRSKFIQRDYMEDQDRLMAFYNGKGHRNAKILIDTVYNHSDNTVNVKLGMKEGNKFYFGNIAFLGNSKYKTERLEDRLGLTRGDVYDRVKLEERLFGGPDGGDVSSLYLDNGYLSFNANPVEVGVNQDSIDIEVRIYEGKQYRINKVSVAGNTITNDHVVMREIRTRPGDLFSRADLMRTQRELAALGYFSPEGFGVNPIQNPTEGTVDIEYTVEEKPSDQIELQGGWGGGRLVGTFGVSFNNFSIRNIFKGKKYWTPVPKGDGQRLSIRAQTNGSFYTAYTLSFVEPWLGGRKPNSFSLSVQRSKQTNGLNVTDSSIGAQELVITGGSLGLGKRLTRPDDYFQLFVSGSYQHYSLLNFGSIFSFATGTSNNLAITGSILRDSRSINPIFYSSGSKTGLTVKVTPLAAVHKRGDFSNATDQDKFDWVQYHKWKFTSEWYTPLSRRSEDGGHKFVLYTKVGAGYLGNFNKTIGDSPFERFYLGGSALTGFQLDGREIIALRGYDDLSLSPATGSTFINKYSMELRYLISPNPNATIFGLGFLEAGDTWSDFKDFNPFAVKRSTGVGLRIFLPMFGLMGLDYGWRLDDVLNNPGMPLGQFHFTIGMNLGEL